MIYRAARNYIAAATFLAAVLFLGSSVFALEPVKVSTLGNAFSLVDDRGKNVSSPGTPPTSRADVNFEARHTIS